MSSACRTFLRASTVHKSALSQEKPFEGQGRTILPLKETPSLTATSSLLQIDEEVSAIKSAHRIHCYYIHAVIEDKLSICLNRGKTSLQGTQAPKGWQASHGSLAPTTTDTKMSTLVEHVVKNGSTPTKTTPFLQNRMELCTEDIQLLNEQHSDAGFVKNFLQSRLPRNGMHSVLEGTRFHWNCNATFENPDESNRYDSSLERTIANYVKTLQQERIEHSISIEESTQKLVEWLIDYYKKSMTNLESQLNNLTQLSKDLNGMYQFEKSYIGQEISTNEFDTYLANVDSFLEHHKAILEKKIGCPFLKELKFLRNDITFLTRLSKSASDKEKSLDYFQKNSCHFQRNTRNLPEPPPMDLTALQQKCTFHSQEARAQLSGIEVFEEACTIPSLSKMHFGIMENGVRRAPTEAELLEQVYALTKLASPVKKKIETTQMSHSSGTKRKLFQSLPIDNFPLENLLEHQSKRKKKST